jgi:hypothetical protein
MGPGLEISKTSGTVALPGTPETPGALRPGGGLRFQRGLHHGLGEMKNSLPGGRARKLVYLPIIHTAADMGTLGASIRGMKLSTLGRQGLKQNAAVVDKMWEELERVVSNLPVPPGTVRVYQDGLPVSGHEQEIVSELAAAGHRNHGLLLKLQARGATLMGTESPELLVEEYQLATAAFACGASARTEVRQKQLRDTLLEKRDRYIGDRINRTLGAGESGILFMGMLHQVTRYLDPDIAVVYPLGPPRARQGRGV